MFWTVVKMAPLSVAIYPFCALLAWLMTLIAWLLSPMIAGISMATGKKDVSGPLSYFYTHNASLDGGVEQKVDGYDPAAKGFRLWWQRVCWICRNPAYKFCAHVLGFKGMTGNQDIVWSSGQAYPDPDFLYVIKSPSGRLFFGYRGKRCWIGWNYTTYGGYHQLKSKPFSF